MLSVHVQIAAGAPAILRLHVSGVMHRLVMSEVAVSCPLPVTMTGVYWPAIEKCYELFTQRACGEGGCIELYLILRYQHKQPCILYLPRAVGASAVGVVIFFFTKDSLLLPDMYLERTSKLIANHRNNMMCMKRISTETELGYTLYFCSHHAT